jgi:hypothetical protein
MISNLAVESAASAQGELAAEAAKDAEGMDRHSA